jgi:hypothetical protein
MEKRMTNKVTIEVDLDAILTASNRQDALYKAVRDDVLSRSSVVTDIRDRIIGELIKETAFNELKDKVTAELQKAATSPDAVSKAVASKSYEISGIVMQIIKDRKDIMENEVLRYMALGDFKKNIAETVERNLTSRVEYLIMPAPRGDD